MAVQRGEPDICLILSILTNLRQLTTVLHRLHDLWWSSLTIMKRRKFATIRITSTDQSSPIPPAQAPYNFGISPEWMTKYGETYKDQLGDWGTFEDLDGFGTKALHSPMLTGEGSMEEYVDLNGGVSAGDRDGSFGRAAGSED